MLLALFFLAALPAEPKIDAISLQIFDRVSNKIVPFDKQPDPYGMNMDLLVSVKLKGPSTLATALTLTLVASAPGSTSEATGDVPGWKVERSQLVSNLSEAGASWFVFVVPFVCTERASFVARIGKEEKTLKKTLGCAE